jgi:hypothetical protein
MDKTLSTPKHKGRSKGKNFVPQMQRVFAAFSRQPKTMLMVAVETGIMRSNITRYVAKWKKQRCIKIVRYGICPISKHHAGFYTTNNNSFSQPLKLF